MEHWLSALPGLYAHLGSRNSNRPDRSELRDLDARTAGIVVIDKKWTIVVPLKYSSTASRAPAQ